MVLVRRRSSDQAKRLRQPEYQKNRISQCSEAKFARLIQLVVGQSVAESNDMCICPAIVPVQVFENRVRHFGDLEIAVESCWIYD